MPRRALPRSADTAVARVRAWFGLTIADLALFLDVSPALVQGLETGARRATPTVLTALLPLLRLLPPPAARAEAEAQAAAADAAPPIELPAPVPPLAPGTPPPTAANLTLRAEECRHRAARLLAQAATLARRARVAARWAEVLPALLPPDPDADPTHDPAAAAYYAALPPDPLGDPTYPRNRARWLRGWLRHRARPLTPAEATRYYRLRAQAAGLLAEAAALATIGGENWK